MPSRLIIPLLVEALSLIESLSFKLSSESDLLGPDKNSEFLGVGGKYLKVTKSGILISTYRTPCLDRRCVTAEGTAGNSTKLEAEPEARLNGLLGKKEQAWYGITIGMCLGRGLEGLEDGAIRCEEG